MNTRLLLLVSLAALATQLFAVTAWACEEHFEEAPFGPDYPDEAPPEEVDLPLGPAPEAPAVFHIRWTVADEEVEYASRSAGMLEVEMAAIVEDVNQYELELTYQTDGQSARIHAISQFGQAVVKTPLEAQLFETNEVAVRMRAVMWDAEPSPWTPVVVVTGRSLSASGTGGSANGSPLLMTGCDVRGESAQDLSLFGLLLVLGALRRRRGR